MFVVVVIIIIAMFIHHKVVNIKDRKRQTTCIQREKKVIT